MGKENQPLAFRMRPTHLGEFVGQEHLVGEGKPLRVALENKKMPTSIIFWGPPGCGKTTLARLICRLTEGEFVGMSSVSAGKDDVRKAVNKAKLFQKKIILFLDEIHRFNKAQQDFLLPFVEDGTLLLIGATTENPSFEVISALLSRSRVFVLNRLGEEHLREIVGNALESENGFNGELIVSDEGKKLISQLANGDARSALNILEIAESLIAGKGMINVDVIMEAAQKSFLNYDKDGEEHYNIISALHKSMRDSDVDAAVYWTMRMIEGGEDPKYIIRRMIRFASEDIGNADPQALQVATATKDAVEFLGYPECDTALVQTAIYLANAKKSNSAYKAVGKAREDIQKTGNLPVPMHLRNAPTQLMKEIGYGKGYKYAHNYENAEVDQKHLPVELEGRKYVEEMYVVDKKKRVLCAGTFDRLHTGHLEYFKRAKELVDNGELFVIVARDDNSEGIKNKKTINNENDRLKVISDLDIVDKAVLGFGKGRIVDRVVSLMPDVIALGYDQWAEEDWLDGELKRRGLEIKILRMDEYKKEFL